MTEISTGYFGINWGFGLRVIDDPTYARNSADNNQQYDHEHCREVSEEHSCAYGVFINGMPGHRCSAVLLGRGAATALHDKAVILNDNDSGCIFICCGDSLFALRISDLGLAWCAQVDPVACQSIHWIEESACVITVGEREVRCYGVKGEDRWGFIGRAKFSGDYSLHATGIEAHFVTVTDVDGNEYKIDMQYGSEYPAPERVAMRSSFENYAYEIAEKRIPFKSYIRVELNDVTDNIPETVLLGEVTDDGEVTMLSPSKAASVMSERVPVDPTGMAPEPIVEGFIDYLKLRADPDFDAQTQGESEEEDNPRLEYILECCDEIVAGDDRPETLTAAKDALQDDEDNLVPVFNLFVLEKDPTRKMVLARILEGCIFKEVGHYLALNGSSQSRTEDRVDPSMEEQELLEDRDGQVDEDFKFVLEMIGALGSCDGDLSVELYPISSTLSKSPQCLARLRDFFCTGKDAGFKNDILLTLSCYAADLVDADMRARGFDWDCCRYEFCFDGSLLDIYIQGIDLWHWQMLLDCLRHGDDDYRFFLNGEAAPLPEHALQLFTGLRNQGYLTIDCGATLDCHFFDDKEIELSVDMKKQLEIESLFEFMAYLAVMLDRPVKLTPENLPEKPLFVFDPTTKRLDSFPANFQAQVGKGVAGCPQLRAENLRIDEPLRTWGDILVRLDWDVSLLIGETVLFTEDITAAELAWLLEIWLRSGFREKKPFVFDSMDDERVDLLQFHPAGDQWRIESCLIDPDEAPTVTSLQLKWCVETFIDEVSATTQKATGRRLSFLFKGLVELDEDLSGLKQFF